MACEYKLVDVDEEVLNDHGLAFWQVVGIATQGTDEKVVLQRDTTIQVVADGLSDPPPGRRLFCLVIAPVEPHSVDLRECMTYLNKRPIGEYKTAPDRIVSACLSDGIVEESFEVRSSGRVEYTRRDVAHDRIVPDIHWAERAGRYAGDIGGLFQHWGYDGDVRGVLTVAGIKGHTFLTDRNFRDGFPANVPFVQVALQGPAASIFTEGHSPMLKDLFGKLYWSLGSPQNLAFAGE